LGEGFEVIVGEQTVPFVDLARQHAAVEAELEAAYQRVVERGSFTLSEEVEAFEREFADYVTTSHGVGVASGTDALMLSLRALGVGAGDEVITAVNTFAATAEAIVLAGATPVFVDIDPATFLLDLDAVEAAITERTAAIVPVHLYGQCCDMERVMAIARRHGLKVVEDACQAHGATRNGKSAGCLGDAGCFSFYPSKNLGALGDGGFVATNDPELADRVRLLRCHGEGADRLHVEVGYTSRLHGMQAAFLRAKLPMLDHWNGLRHEAAMGYLSALEGAPIILPETVDGASHVYHVFCVRVNDRDAVRARLSEAGVQTGIHYALPLHLEPAFAHLGGSSGQFPVAEKAIGEILSLPMFPYLTAAEVDSVSDAVREAISNG
jgi:dTDP-4-amino-4,6-dideoxygalactose transaminase